jgi:hypothetical protein
MASTPMNTINKKCSTPGCTGKVTARGFCVKCYYRLLRHNQITPKTQTQKWKHRLSNINEDQRTANCAECGQVKIIKRSKKQWRCSIDANYRSKLYKKAYRQSKKDILKSKCEICGSTNDLCWDHNHKTGNFRGTLCKKCNVAIGLLKDNINFLKKAIIYLNKNESRTLQERKI